MRIVETFLRVFVEEAALDRTIASYANLLSGMVTMRFDYPQAGREPAAVSSQRLSILIVAGALRWRRPG